MPRLLPLPLAISTLGRLVPSATTSWQHHVPPGSPQPRTPSSSSPCAQVHSEPLVQLPSCQNLQIVRFVVASMGSGSGTASGTGVSCSVGEALSSGLQSPARHGQRYRAPLWCSCPEHSEGSEKGLKNLLPEATDGAFRAWQRPEASQNALKEGRAVELQAILRLDRWHLWLRLQILHAMREAALHAFAAEALALSA